MGRVVASGVLDDDEVYLRAREVHLAECLAVASGDEAAAAVVVVVEDDDAGGGVPSG